MTNQNSIREERQDNSSTSTKLYRIEGCSMGGLLAQRLDETHITGFKSLQGIIVYTKNGPYYSEIFEESSAIRIPRDKIGEDLYGLVNYATKTMAGIGIEIFSYPLNLSN